MAIGGNNQTLSVTIGANMDPSGVLSAVKQMQSAFSGLKLPGNIGADLEKSFDKATDLLKKYQTQLSKGINTKTDAKNITKTGSQINEVLDEIVTHINSINGQQIFLKADVSGLNTLKTNIENARTAWKNAIQEFRKGSDIEKVLNEIAEKTTRSNLTQGSISSAKTLFDKGDLEGYRNALDDIYNRLKNLKDTTIKNVVENLGLQDAGSKAANLDQIKKRLEDISKIDFSGDSNVDTKFKAITTAVTEYETEVKRASQAGQNAFNNINVDKTVKDTRDLVDATDQYKNSVMSAKDQVQQLQQSTQYFFSLRNMINLLKRGISEAIQTVKELDKAMTETAVVTDFSVGDMWEKLPEYTANANRLGATIQDMYESTTLYYQQGLNTQQSMAIATETMKMARIAGLEAKDATDMMTAALRGFNMELNEASATRINDVYSNLAAKTASDTEEIGKAMQRTASIAHSAGMSFEGTAAFLAQAVETTREPAENIGTAMKTIVARFQEMKKNPLEIAEVDGEEVSYNKVDTALQSIGVSLKDANGQFRELDKVFLDISKRWDGLTQTQQRYIATIAAGSRQQSRFIAMMGDYNRTTELMSYANDSAGASQEQFNKTLDSLEAKINKFQNAWDQFLMGIMNDSATKFVVDAGTKILDIVNKIIDKLSFNGELGIVKSLLSIATAFTALKAGGNIVNKLIGGLGGLVDPTSSFGKGFWGAGKTTPEGTPTTGIVGKITTPIVAKLNELIAVTRQANNLKNTNIQTTSTLGQYKNIAAILRNPQSLNIGDINALLNNLSDEHAYTAFKNAPGTIDAMKKAIVGQLPTAMQSAGGQLMTNIVKGMKKKEIPVKKGAELIGKPQLWGKYLGTETAKEFSKQYIESQKGLWETQTTNARKQAWIQAGGSAFATDDVIKEYLTTHKDSEVTRAFVSNYKQIRKTMESLSDVPIQLDKYQQLSNNIGMLGSRFSAAGMSLQMFGTQLSQLSPALQGVGSLLTQIGTALMTFGTGVSAIGAKIIGLGGAIVTAFKVASNMAEGIGGTVGAKLFASSFFKSLFSGISPAKIGLTLGAILIGGIILAKQHAEKKAKEAGEEVRKNFEKGFTETNQKIDSILDYKDRFNELSKGVDQFGHNISLTNEEYDEYLSINRDLQELSPSLIAGYNAEGQAILRKGKAIDEVIDKLKEEKNLSLASYIDDDSINKLIKEYNTSDAYKKHNTIKKGDSGIGDAFNSEKSSISKAIKAADLEWSDFSQILDELGIGGAKSVSQLTSRQLSLISAHYTDILNKIKEFNPQIEDEAEEGLKEAFAKTNNTIEDILTEGAPIIESLRQWMGQEGLDAVGLELGEEFVSGFNSGLEGLMLEGLTKDWKPEEYKQQLRDYAEGWKELAGPTTKYSTLLAEADKIQREYLSNIGKDDAVKNYTEQAEDLATQLEQLAEQDEITGAAGEVFAQQCIEQANALRTYATEGVISLKEALNTMTDEIAEAEGALESFNKVAEGSNYSTAATNMQKIYEEATSDVHTAGKGDQTFWAGAEALVGRQAILDVDGDKEKVQELMNSVNKMLKGGQEGWDAFKDKWFANADANFTVLGDGTRKLLDKNNEAIDGLFLDENNGIAKIDENLNPNVYQEIAEALDMSEDSLIAMLNLGRQFGEINFTNIDQVRKALEVSDSVIKGITKNGQQNLYIKDETLNAELASAGITDVKQQEDKKAEMEAKGIHVIKEAGEIAVKDFTDMGVNSMESLISIFDATGQFTKNEMAEYAQKWAELNNVEWDPEKFNEKFDEHVQELEKGDTLQQLDELQSLNSTATNILSVLAKDVLTKQEQDALYQKIGQQKAQEYYEKNGLGNTSIDNRQVLDWGSNPRENSNFAAAKTWGWTASDLKDSISTYMAQAMTFGEGENAVALTFTPMLQGENGSPQVLSSSTVQNYLNTIISKATDETGKVNLQELFELDKQGLEVEGQEINNLLMGAFTGEGMDQAAGALGELEHQLEANKQKASDLNAEMNKTQQPPETSAPTPTPTPTPAPVPPAAQHAEDHDINYHVNVDGEEQLDNTEQKGIRLSELASAGLNFLIKASCPEVGDTLNTIQQVKDAVATKPTLQVDADTSPITTMAEKIAGVVGTYTVKIAATQSGLGGILSTLGSILSRITSINNTKVKPAAKGQNNYIPYRAPIHAGSLAKGTKSRYGQVGPRDKGGLTLTGEKGFEIAWLPSENRSMILGATGPQMLNLPADAVVYTHEQSKDILKRKEIPAGSHYTEGSMNRTGGSGGSTGKKSSKKSSKKSKKKSKKKKDKKEAKEQEIPKIINYSIEETIRFNIDAGLEKLGYEIDKRTKSIEKTLNKIGATSKDVAGDVSAQLQALNQQKNANQALLDSYKRQSNEIFNWQETISYQDWTTKTETTGKGKKKKTTTTTELGSVDGVINLRDYMIQQADGSYIANEQAIRAAGNASRQKAIQDAVSNAVSSINKGMLDAQKVIDETEEKMAELEDQVYEAFKQWEKQITTIYILSQKLETATKIKDVYETRGDLELTRLQAGFTDLGNSLKILVDASEKSINQLRQEIVLSQNLATEKVAEFNKAIQYSTYEEKFRGQTSNQAQQDYNGTIMALDLFYKTGGDIRAAQQLIPQVIKEYQSKEVNLPTEEFIKKQLDNFHQLQMDSFDAISENLTLVQNAFDKLIEYQETIKSFEDTLLEGLEEQTEKEIDKLSDLSDAISKALKDLLDDVKRKLDERRQQEDNLKTEQDISKKQQRLAALRANTAGGNQVEIARLEQEIADAQEQYQRSREDQLLNKLQEQADTAEQQRQQQIDLLETQNSLAAENNRILVETWLRDPEKYKEQIFEVWKMAQDYDSETKLGQQLLDNQFKSEFAEMAVAVKQTNFNEYFNSVGSQLNTLVSALYDFGNKIPTPQEIANLIKNPSSVTNKTVAEAQNFKKQGWKVKDLKAAGWDAKTLSQVYGISELRGGGFTVKDLNNAGIKDITKLKGGGYGVSEFKTAGYGVKDLKPYFTAAQLKSGGFTNLADYKAAKFTYAQLREGNLFSDEELSKAGYEEATRAIELRKQQELKQKQDKYNSLLNNFMYMSSWYDPSSIKQLLDAGKALNKTPSQIGEDLGMKGIKEGIYHELLFSKTGAGHLFDRFKWGGARNAGVNDSDIRAIAEGIRRGYNKRLSNLDPWERDRLRKFGIYKTGGLNTTTGPAWLDGTPSKPELVLNSTDTKNFLALRDVLSKAMGSTKSINNSYGGDNIFEININVDKIEKDYDVDRVADRVKKKILDSSSYRNVTQVRNFR